MTKISDSSIRLTKLQKLILCSMILLFFLFSSYHYLYVVTSTFQSNSLRIEHTSTINAKIHIITVSDDEAQRRYQQHSNTLFCYAHRHGYHFTSINPHHYYACSVIENYYFKKHCAVIQYLIQNPNVQWLVVLDGDTFVVNATKTIDAFLPIDPDIHVVHYERFMDNEIMAGNYIIRNHPWSLFYLNEWVEYFKKIPSVGHHNHDNGAIHLHFLNMTNMVDRQTFDKCAILYNQSHDEGLYMKYVACTKCALRGKRKFTHMILHRRGQSFCRDNGLSPYKIHQLDLMFHGFKQDLTHFFQQSIDTSTCINETNWTPILRSSLVLSDIESAKLLMRDFEKHAMDKFHTTVAYLEITNCWPNCDTDITGEALTDYMNALCN